MTPSLTLALLIIVILAGLGLAFVHRLGRHELNATHLAECQRSWPERGES